MSSEMPDSAITSDLIQSGGIEAVIPSAKSGLVMMSEQNISTIINASEFRRQLEPNSAITAHLMRPSPAYITLHLSDGTDLEDVHLSGLMPAHMKAYAPFPSKRAIGFDRSIATKYALLNCAAFINCFYDPKLLEIEALISQRDDNHGFTTLEKNTRPAQVFRSGVIKVFIDPADGRKIHSQIYLGSGYYLAKLGPDVAQYIGIFHESDIAAYGYSDSQFDTELREWIT